ncbi:uncharacterized [Tachysurus ichikawai]
MMRMKMNPGARLRELMAQVRMWCVDIFSEGFPHHLLLQLLLSAQSWTPLMLQAPDKHAGCAASVAMATGGRC